MKKIRQEGENRRIRNKFTTQLTLQNKQKQCHTEKSRTYLANQHRPPVLLLERDKLHIHPTLSVVLRELLLCRSSPLFIKLIIISILVLVPLHTEGR